MEERQFKLAVGKTEAGKEIQIVRDSRTNLFYMEYSSGGELPAGVGDPWNNLEAIKSYALTYMKNLKILRNDRIKEARRAKSIDNKKV